MSSQSRHVYTRQERLILEASFARQSHPDIHEKERLANILNCNLIQISNWFQNHRVCQIISLLIINFYRLFFLASNEKTTKICRIKHYHCSFSYLSTILSLSSTDLSI